MRPALLLAAVLACATAGVARAESKPKTGLDSAGLTAAGVLVGMLFAAMGGGLVWFLRREALQGTGAVGRAMRRAALNEVAAGGGEDADPDASKSSSAAANPSSSSALEASVQSRVEPDSIALQVAASGPPPQQQQPVQPVQPQLMQQQSAPVQQPQQQQQQPQLMQQQSAPVQQQQPVDADALPPQRPVSDEIRETRARIVRLGYYSVMLLSALLGILLVLVAGLSGGNSWRHWEGSTVDADLFFRPHADTVVNCKELLDPIPEAEHASARLTDAQAIVLFSIWPPLILFSITVAERVVSSIMLELVPDNWRRRFVHIVRRNDVSFGAGSPTTKLFMQLCLFFAIDPLLAVTNTCGAESMPALVSLFGLFNMVGIVVAVFVNGMAIANRRGYLKSMDPSEKRSRCWTVFMWTCIIFMVSTALITFPPSVAFSIPTVSDIPFIVIVKLVNLGMLCCEIGTMVYIRRGANGMAYSRPKAPKKGGLVARLRRK